MNVSLIIASRGRPEHLGLLLNSLRFQRDTCFEVIVVTDLDAQSVPIPAPYTVRVLNCPDANLSKARNIGIAASGGDIIAFCDDDAVPEPNWLARLTKPFENSAVNAACGFVRGRNGVSYQWTALSVDAYGNDIPLSVSQNELRAGVTKTVGTNSAFRKSALIRLGGFDEAYRFFLEDADINTRLTTLGGKTAIVPRAEVHHAFAPSALRHFNRVPKSLFEIGASKAHFCKIHGEPDQIDTELAGFADAQNQRLIRFHDLGLLDAKAMRVLRRSLQDGFTQGLARKSHTPLTAQSGPFQPFTTAKTAQTHVLKAGLFGANAQHKKAAKLAAAGHEVALIQFIYTPRRLTVGFTKNGYWHHFGGVFGKGLRSDPLLRLSSRSARLACEAQRLADIRTNETN